MRVIALATTNRITLSAPSGSFKPGQDAAQERPATTDWLAGNVPQWSDPPADELNADCYAIIRTTDLVFFPVTKRAQQLRSMRVVVHGEGAQAEFLQHVIDQSYGLPEAIEWLAKFGPTEGCTFLWIKEALRGGVIVADLRGAGRHKANAGGSLRLVYENTATGRQERIYKQQEWAAASGEQAELASAELPRERLVVYRPGAGSSPEGDLELAWMLYLLARRAQTNDAHWETYGDKWVLPVWLIRQAVENMRPGTTRGKLLGLADAVQELPAGGSMAVDQNTLVELLKAGTEGATTLDMIERSIERRAHRLLLHNELTSMVTTGDRGNTLVGKSEQDLVIESEALAIAEALDQLLAYLKARNEAMGLLPALKEGEPEPYIRLEPAAAAKSIDPYPAIAAYNAGVELPSVWFYEQALGSGTPEVVGETIRKTFELPTPPVVPPPMFGGGGTLPPDTATGADDQPQQPEQDPSEPPPGDAPDKAKLAHSRARRVLLDAGDTESRELAAMVAACNAAIGEEMASAWSEHARAEAESRAWRIPDATANRLGVLAALSDLAGRARLFRELRSLSTRARLDKDAPRRISVVFRESLDLPFDEAVTSFVNRAIVPISPAASASAAAIENLVARVYRNHGFTMARVADETMLAEVKAKLETFLREGSGDRREFADWFAERNPDLPKSYAETVFRNNVNAGYSAGRARQMRESADELGGWEWVTSRDNAVRPAHAVLDGKVFPMSRTDLMPPKAHNCRCTAIPVEPETRAMNDAAVEATVAKAIESDPGFANWIREPGADVYGD